MNTAMAKTGQAIDTSCFGEMEILCNTYRWEICVTAAVVHMVHRCRYSSFHVFPRMMLYTAVQLEGTACLVYEVES